MAKDFFTEQMVFADLLSVYGGLLPDRQEQVLRLHYEQDLSLSEIAEQLQVTRQAVYDAINKGRSHLNRLEEHLGLVSGKWASAVSDEAAVLLDELENRIVHDAPLAVSEFCQIRLRRLRQLLGNL